MKLLLATLCLGFFTANAFAIDAGRYELPNGDDVLVINPDGAGDTLSYEITRQVGGPGGISDAGVVPYPTICRYKEWGTDIRNEDDKSFQFTVKFVHLSGPQEPRYQKDCEQFVGEFNGRAAASVMMFTIDKSGFVKVK